VGLRSPPSQGRGSAPTASLPRAGPVAGRSRPDPLPVSVRSWGPSRARALVDTPQPRQGLWSPGPPGRACDKETEGAPTFPSSPGDSRPRSETPGVSGVLALPHPGRRPSGHGKPSAFLSVWPCEFSGCPRLSPGRGSITRPASSFHPAPSGHGWVCTWRSLLTCWLGCGQLGLAPSVRTHWVTTTNFMGCLPMPRSRVYLGATSAGLGAGDEKDIVLTRLLPSPWASHVGHGIDR
jgi:hypothetical protein